jgi:pilus assembly protein CpaB
MRRSNLLVLLFAIVMGGIAAFMARNWIAAQASVQPTAPQGTMVVASAPLAFGSALTSDNTTEISWSAGRLPEGAYSTKEELLKDGKRAVLSAVARDEPILKSKITGPGQRASLSALLEEGKRAVTVRVDDVRGVAGFVLPGDRVDVVLIRTVSRANGPAENISDVLLQHVKVLAVDQLLNERQEAPTVAKAVTLEVATDQAQKVLLATNIGKLSLILRQAGEGDAAMVKRITESDLGVAEFRAAERPAPVTTASGPSAPARTSGAVVEVVRGTRSEKYNVSRTIE